MTPPNRMPIEGLKPKDMVGIPWRVAFALQAAGWYLRSDVIWAKAHEFCPGQVGSTMPLGGKKADRPTPAHEYLFLLTKSETYYYDDKAVEQQGVYPAGTRAAKGSATREGNRRSQSEYAVYSGKRRLRDVWFISTGLFTKDHFATFPLKLVEPCVLAGSRPGDLIFDPFIGSGTTGAVAERLMRRWVGTDLSYQHLARERTAQRGLREVTA